MPDIPSAGDLRRIANRLEMVIRRRKQGREQKKRDREERIQAARKEQERQQRIQNFRNAWDKGEQHLLDQLVQSMNAAASHGYTTTNLVMDQMAESTLEKVAEVLYKKGIQFAARSIGTSHGDVTSYGNEISITLDWSWKLFGPNRPDIVWIRGDY